MSQTRVQLIGDSFDTGAIFNGTVAAIDVDISRNAIISGITTIGELAVSEFSSPEVKTDAISNESGTGPIELKEGAILPAGKTLSGDGGIAISGDSIFVQLSAVGIQVNTIADLAGTGPVELKEGATLPASKTLGGGGDISISGDITGGTISGGTIISTNPIKVDKITNKLDNGPVELKEGATLPIGKTLSGDGDINISGNVTIGGLLTYEDVTNVDSVGLITARTGIQVLSGISTFKGAHFDAGNLIKETTNISSSSFDSDNNIDLDNGMIDYRSTALGAITSLNLTCGVSVNDKMSTGEAITVNAITAVSSESNYINDITIDGVAVNSLNWTNEIPSDGGSSGVDVYTFTVLKTGDSQFLVIGNQTKTS